MNHAGRHLMHLPLSSEGGSFSYTHLRVGALVGRRVGTLVGTLVGRRVGTLVGRHVGGRAVGRRVGGRAVGRRVGGRAVGRRVGGRAVGRALSSLEEQMNVGCSKGWLWRKKKTEISNYLRAPSCGYTFVLIGLTKTR